VSEPAFFGHDPHTHTPDGHLIRRWKVRKARFAGDWKAFPPDASPALHFPTHAEALEWATRITPHIEQWLANQKESK
jgi:hypothetical protein